MDFIHGQETLTSIEWILRAVISFFFLLIAAKMMGQRSISQLRLLDFVMALLLGNIIAHPLSDEQLGLKGSMLTTGTVVVLYACTWFLHLKWSIVRKFLEPSPHPLIKNGHILYKELSKARITLDFLLSELRKQKIDDPGKVALALWEPDGTISFFLFPKYESLTPADINLPPHAFELPKMIIREGKIDWKHLKEAGKDESWLRKKINDTDIKNILLATIDHNDRLKIFLYK